MTGPGGVPRWCSTNLILTVKVAVARAATGHSIFDQQRQFWDLSSDDCNFTAVSASIFYELFNFSARFVSIFFFLLILVGREFSVSNLRKTIVVQQPARYSTNKEGRNSLLISRVSGLVVTLNIIGESLKLDTFVQFFFSLNLSNKKQIYWCMSVIPFSKPFLN